MNELTINKEDLELIARVGFEADEFYEEIAGYCNLESDDPLVKAALIGELKVEFKQQLVLSIWKYMSDEQAAYFEKFQTEEFKINPDEDLDTILITFALSYPDLMEKVYKDLAEFVIEFVIDFNDLRAA